ncbi:MAG: hypothetical protein NCW75_02105 [Phycisphaera sp.]|nr:MAG: hypothetical protein NCW75_02105 [Phycisphaera sp.]
MRRIAAGLGVLVVAAVAWAQEGSAIAPISEAYRQQPTAERMEIEVSRGKAPAARSEMIVAVRPGEQPAIALALGRGDPLRIYAEPGRLLAWRQSDRSRVFTAVLPEPFGRGAIESVLPPLLAPQIDLALAGEPDRLLALMPPLSWSRVASGESDRYAGVAFGAALELNVGADFRLVAMEVQREGTVLARATIESVEVDSAWFEPIPLDGTIVESLAELGRTPGPVRENEIFGHAIGVDARGRATTLHAVAVAGDAERVVVLMVDARQAEDRMRLAGALAEADLAGIATALDARVVVLAVGEGTVASLFERVTRSSRSDTSRVRALAIDATPAWAPPLGEGIAFAVHGPSWLLVGSHAVPAAEQQPTGMDDPFEVSEAPRSLAERLAEVVGAAARE